jgi:uncharacterized protein (DUF427 family)
MKATWLNLTKPSSSTNNHYFPPNSIKGEFFSPIETHTTCHWKGIASYFNIRVGDQSNADAAWYEVIQFLKANA